MERPDNVDQPPLGVMISGETVSQIHRRRKSVTEILRPDLEVKTRPPSLCSKCGMVPAHRCGCGFDELCKSCRRAQHVCTPITKIEAKIARAELHADLTEDNLRQREEDHRLEMSALKLRYEMLIENMKQDYERKLLERDDQCRRYQFLIETIQTQKDDLALSGEKNERYSTARIEDLKRQLAEYEEKFKTLDPPPLIYQEPPPPTPPETKPLPPKAPSRVKRSSTSTSIKDGKLVVKREKDAKS